MLYTSGSTGNPKGMEHTSGGYITYAQLSHREIFDYRPGDVYACVADIGWITGHSYVCYGPLANGATSVLFESVPTYPTPARYWQMIEVSSQPKQRDPCLTLTLTLKRQDRHNVLHVLWVMGLVSHRSTHTKFTPFSHCP